MRKYIFILLVSIGLINLFSSCEKDETKATMLESPVPPSLTTVPDLVLKRGDASKSLQFIGTEADFGFQSSVTYNLEAELAGNEFANPIAIASSKVDTFNTTVNDFNSILIKTIPESETSAMELRVRAVLTIETSGAKPIVSISDAKAVNITTYGPPKLAFTTAGKLQAIISPTDNKIYTGWMYTDGTAFQLTNKDNGKIYGGDPSALTENGAAITIPAGAYNLTVDLNTGVMAKTDVTIGIIGDAVGGWSDDTKMVYNFTDHTWNITKTVTAGGIKFRTHGDWSHVNVAYNPAGHDLNNLYQSLSSADSQNIDDIAPGNYNIKLYLETTPMKVVFTPVTK